GLSDIDSNPFTYALVAVTLIGSALIYFSIRLLAGKPPPAMPGPGGHPSQRTAMGGLRGLLCASFFLLICALALLPQLGVILVSFSKDWYQTILPRSFTLQHYVFALG